jgi:hypothetical protein
MSYLDHQPVLHYFRLFGPQTSPVTTSQMPTRRAVAPDVKLLRPGCPDPPCARAALRRKLRDFDNPLPSISHPFWCPLRPIFSTSFHPSSNPRLLNFSARLHELERVEESYPFPSRFQPPLLLRGSRTEAELLSSRPEQPSVILLRIGWGTSFGEESHPFQSIFGFLYSCTYP